MTPTDRREMSGLAAACALALFLGMVLVWVRVLT